MSLKGFPILYVNLVGEMIYILEQRLKQMDQDKSCKVIKDIICAVFSKQQLDDIFKPGPIPARSILRKKFDELAHTSCMKLTESSMDKLFDLMTMTSKYQTQSIIYPEQILTVAINHLNGVKQLLDNDADVNNCIGDAHIRLITLYRPTLGWEWCMIRCDLLAYYQDCKIKISLLMRQGRQRDDGTFIIRLPTEPFWLRPYDTIPGVVNYFDEDGNIYKREEPDDKRWKSKPKAFGFLKCRDTFDLEDVTNEKRSTQLGHNMFVGGSSSLQNSSGNLRKTSPVPQGDELKLLESIFGRSKRPQDSTNVDWVDLNMFDEEVDNDLPTANNHQENNIMIGNVVKKIDATRNKKSLDMVMNELNFDYRPTTRGGRKPRGTDILNMMDEAASRPYTVNRNGTVNTRSRSVAREYNGAAASLPRLPSAKTRTSSTGPPSRITTGSSMSRSPSMGMNIAPSQWNAIYG